jgi:hypothetical protein
MCYIRDRDKGDPCKRPPSRGNCKTVSRKQALETGADIRVERPHSVNGDRYRTPRMARNGAVFATTSNSERETRLVGWGAWIQTATFVK